MATIPAIKTTNDTDIRDAVAIDSITQDIVADRLDALADELLARGIGIVDITGDLATLNSNDHVIALVKDYGIFIDTATGPANADTIFDGVGGRFWQLVARASVKTASGTYTPTSTDSNIASKTWAITHYIRMGNEVHINGGVLVATTAAAAATMDLTLPVASTFTVSTDASGVVYDVDGVTTLMTITANVGTTIRFAFTSVDTASHIIRFSIIYTIKP